MRVLLLGAGGRESALAWKIAQSSILDALYIAPGNAGTKQWGKNVALNPLDFEAVKAFALEHDIQMIVVGPEEPLVNGIYNFFNADPAVKHIGIIGPSSEGAALEGSKSFAKDFMQRHGIPTAKYGTFTLEKLKGVVILNSLQEAENELTTILLDEKFGEAGKTVVIEQFLTGIELSVFVVTDGTSFKLLPEAKDYKRIGEKDTGLNTGGMGAVSPVPFADKAFMDKVLNQVIIPTMKGIRKEGFAYQGFLFFGLINVKNEPYVIEYNCRMGDPETEVVIPRIKSDLLDLLEGVWTGTLSERDIQFTEHAAATVMMVSGGYPESYEKGKVIFGLNSVTDSLVFQAGTVADGPKTLTNGGRVLAVTSYGKTLDQARHRSYDNLTKITFENAYFRRDIGKDLA